MSKIAGELNAEMMNGRETIESLRQQLALYAAIDAAMGETE